MDVPWGTELNRNSRLSREPCLAAWISSRPTLPTLQPLPDEEKTSRADAHVGIEAPSSFSLLIPFSLIFAAAIACICIIMARQEGRWGRTSIVNPRVHPECACASNSDRFKSESIIVQRTINVYHNKNKHYTQIWTISDFYIKIECITQIIVAKSLHRTLWSLQNCQPLGDLVHYCTYCSALSTTATSVHPSHTAWLALWAPFSHH